MRVNKGKGHAMHEGKRIVWALKMWVGEGWGKNLPQPLIYSIVQKRHKETPYQVNGDDYFPFRHVFVLINTTFHFNLFLLVGILLFLHFYPVLLFVLHSLQQGLIKRTAYTFVAYVEVIFVNIIKGIILIKTRSFGNPVTTQFTL